jgi:Fe-S-cluster containining protein
MANLSTAAVTKDGLFEPLKHGTFTFACHKGVDCFTKCCASLNLVLTPYDILRMKNRLGMTSDDFLLQYTETRLDPPARFSALSLKMNQEDKRCPFVNSQGCTIYEDRPGACRIYPIGRASMKLEQEKGAREKFFLVREGHCLGFREDKAWSIEKWMADQGVDEYNAMNDQWLEIITSQRSLGPEKDLSRKIQMFFMASYNLDKFRQFVFESRFLQLFEIPSGVIDTMAKEDTELMKFAFEWLKFSLFGINTIRIRCGVPEGCSTGPSPR